jgi:membrane-bound lytic murein transglycosylase B
VASTLVLAVATSAAIFWPGSGAKQVGSQSIASAASGLASDEPTDDARAEIPPTYLTLYRRFGREMDIDWRFLASIGGQESNHGRVPGTNLVNHAGCVGPMQIGVGGRCGNFLAAFGIDGNGDGRIEPRNPADAIATAAWGLRAGKGAPAASGRQVGSYYEAACGYYGACADQWVNYADEVMERARRYGLQAS